MTSSAALISGIILGAETIWRAETSRCEWHKSFASGWYAESEF